MSPQDEPVALDQRPTPETDANRHNMGSVSEPHYVVDADFARRLERQRDAAVEALKGALQSMDARPKDAGLHYIRELARATLAEIKESK